MGLPFHEMINAVDRTAREQDTLFQAIAVKGRVQFCDKPVGEIYEWIVNDDEIRKNEKDAAKEKER